MNKLDTDNVVIVGAGPAGLTAALELQSRGARNVTVIEGDAMVGGISRTVAHGGNRIDIGGHRFFSKSDWVMRWWASLLPVKLSGVEAADALFLKYQGQSRVGIPASTIAQDDSDDVLLVRNRLSRIYFGKQFFDYPLKLNAGTLKKLGLKKTVLFGLSYVAAQLNPRKPEKSLEDFFVNRFGERLYRQFFKEYTEKVWGVACREISADWGAQRVKSLSVMKAIAHALRSALKLDGDAAQQTSLIESFLYPKLGPGQMWEHAARRFVEQGGKLHLQRKVNGIDIADGRVQQVTAVDAAGLAHTYRCDQLLSTMPVRDLVAASSANWTDEVKAIASQLQYRDFITVGLLYRKSDLPADLKDNWIYIQEPGVNVGRVQVFNNWSPYMVERPQDTVWLGLEFFCKEGDALWTLSDAEMIALAEKELNEISLVSSPRALDSLVLRVPKAYPGYFGEAFKHFDTLRAALDKVDNLFLIGRNGMHRYNNQDHSMLTALEAVEQIASGKVDKSRIWAINVDDDYHEEKTD